MKPHLTAAIAWRYLISKKSHGAVGTISTVSVCAMAIATAAIICVLSVFNGFRREITVRLDTLLPDIEISPAKGKVFQNAAEIARKINAIEGVEAASPTLSDNALVIFEGQEMPVKIKGVEPDDYASITSIRSLIPENYGRYIEDAEAPTSESVLSVGVAARLRAYPDTRMLIFAPRREGRVNMANPISSFVTDSIYVTGVYSSQQSQFDDDMIILPLSEARKLLQYDDQASAIEVKLSKSANAAQIENKIRQTIGDQFEIKDRLHQQEVNFRMVNIEKWVSFLLLGFILIIASFNIISSLSMMVIDKEGALSTFSALGLSRKKIGRIFAWESLYVALTGGISGILLGLALCAAQQHWGLIKIGVDSATSVLKTYPVEVQAQDIWITLVPIVCIAAITALTTAAFARSRIGVSKK